MIINNMQIDETEVLDCDYEKGIIFKVSDLIDYVLSHPEEFSTKPNKTCGCNSSARDQCAFWDGENKCIHPPRGSND